MILNLYAEADEPRNFIKVAVGTTVFLAVVGGIGVGMLGYLAFGNSCESTILFNMPNHMSIGIAAKICYLITIMGSYVILIQPIYHVIENSEWYINLGGTKSSLN